MDSCSPPPDFNIEPEHCPEPNNAKNYISLRKPCESCIEEGGCSLKHPSTAAPATAISSSLLRLKKRLIESEETAEATISLSLSQSKKRPRESEEAAAIAISSESDESTSDDDSEVSSCSSEATSDEDFEVSSFSSIKKSTVTTVSTSMENEKRVTRSEPEVTNSVGSGKRGKVLKMSTMEKNSEDCGRRGKVLKMSIMEIFLY